MSDTPVRKTKTPKAKVFGVFLTHDDGSEELIEYVEHHSKPQAQAAVLAGKIEVREVDHREMIQIGRDNTPVRWLNGDGPDDGHTDMSFGGTA